MVIWWGCDLSLFLGEKTTGYGSFLYLVHCQVLHNAEMVSSHFLNSGVEMFSRRNLPDPYISAADTERLVCQTAR